MLKSILYLILVFLFISCGNKSKHYITLSEYGNSTIYGWGEDEKYKVEVTDKFEFKLYFCQYKYDSIKDIIETAKCDSLVWKSNELGLTKIIELNKEEKYYYSSETTNDPEAKFHYSTSTISLYYRSEPKYDTIYLREDINDKYNWSYKEQF